MTYVPLRQVDLFLKIAESVSESSGSDLTTKTETWNVICFEKNLISVLSSVHLTNFVKTESASSSVHSNIEFQRRRTPENFRNGCT